MPVLDVEKLIEERTLSISTYHARAGCDRAQLDVSGGVDSAVMLGLLSGSVGPDNITAVYSNINSSPESLERARETADAFDVKLCEINLTDYFESIVQKIMRSMDVAGYNLDEVRKRCEKDPTVLGSIRSTLRAPIGRAFNRLSGGGIRHGTGNECEDRWLRFYQKGGDGEVDTNPLAMLSKGEVYQLAVGLGVPLSVLTAVPSPDLHGNGEGHSDEAELKKTYGVPWTYSRVDPKTGKYTYVGTIERMSRLMDSWKDDKDRNTATTLFPSFTGKEIDKFVQSALRIERETRHKYNPNCPALGTREDLLVRAFNREPLITNSFPEELLE